MESRGQESRLHQHVRLFAELTQWCLGSFLVLSFGEAGRTVSLLLGPTLSVLVCSQLCRRTMLGAEVEPSDPAIGVTDRSVVVAGGSPLLPCHVSRSAYRSGCVKPPSLVTEPDYNISRCRR